jgi:hypothetical protein
MQVVTERFKMPRLAPSSRLRRVALRVKVRCVFEGVWWVAILRVLNMQFPVVVSLVITNLLMAAPAATNQCSRYLRRRR